MKPVEVTARFDAKGKIHPLRVVVEGAEHMVMDAGRRWQAEDGLHILVMLGDFQARELIYNAGESQWYLKEMPNLNRAA